jgi:hypothetical protein
MTNFTKQYFDQTENNIRAASFSITSKARQGQSQSNLLNVLKKNNRVQVLDEHDKFEAETKF